MPGPCLSQLVTSFTTSREEPRMGAETWCILGAPTPAHFQFARQAEKDGQMEWSSRRKSWGLRMGRSTKCCQVGTGSLAEGCQSANAVPEGGWLPPGLCQHQDLLLGPTGGQYWVLLACQVAGPAYCWAEKQQGHGGPSVRWHRVEGRGAHSRTLRQFCHIRFVSRGVDHILEPSPGSSGLALT